MVLPAFASIDDLIDRGVVIADEDAETRAQAALDDVSTLIRTIAAKTWVTDDALDADLPDIVVTVCCAAARRAYENPQNLRSEIYPNYTDVLAGDAPGGVALTADEERLIRGAGADGSFSGLWTLGTTRGPLETGGPCDPYDAPIMLATDGTGGGEPIAWLDPSELPLP